MGVHPKTDQKIGISGLESSNSSYVTTTTQPGGQIRGFLVHTHILWPSAARPVFRIFWIPNMIIHLLKVPAIFTGSNTSREAPFQYKTKLISCRTLHMSRQFRFPGRRVNKLYHTYSIAKTCHPGQKKHFKRKFDIKRPLFPTGLEPTICQFQGECPNHYTTDSCVNYWPKHLLFLEYGLRAR